MKHLAKLFLAVVALFAYACVTDTTEDLGLQVGGGHKTEITLSLEESRTQLGEKVDGLYPLFWSEGDKISINGVESGEATIDQSNPAKATFTFESTLATPYCIAYPAAPAGQVIFAENQTHAGNGTFGSGVSTMYAYGDTTGAQLNHLTGVLKIGVVGNATISFVQISTVDRAPIAGTFDFDFEKGEATATEASKYVINYNCPATADVPNGFVLSNTPQYIHVAVPAGTYDELYVTLYDTEGGVMYATVKANDKKPLAAGKVREFSNTIEYSPNDTVFIIKDKASLKAFAEGVAELKKDVLFVADVDMTGEEWTPVNWDAVSETSDGGSKHLTINGNGYAIKGLTKPLFGTTSATIKGLHLRDVNIVSTDLVHVGSIACDFSGVMSHCSATGTIEQNNTTYNAKALGGYKDVNIGGIIGQAVGATVTHCTNEVDITIKSFADPTVEYASIAGGVVAGAMNGCTFSYLTNKGDITFAATAHKGNLYISGVVGREIDIADQVDLLEISNCENYGAISTTKESASSNDILMAGVTGYLMGNLNLKCDNLTNHGSILAQGECKTLYLNGIMSFKGEANSAKNWINEKTGTLTVDGAKGTSMYLSGTGWQMAGALDNFVNHADITIKNVRDKASSLYIGGVLGTSHGGKKSNIVNNGKLTIGDDITVTGLTRVAGLITEIAYTAGLDFVDIVDSSNNGAISVGGIISEGSGNSGRIYVAGLTTVQNNGIISNCHNTKTATITVKPKTILASETIVAGLISYVTSTSIENEVVGLTNCSNSADVELSPVDSFGTYLGGCIAHCWASKTDLDINLTDVTNSGKITLAGGVLGTSTAEDGTVTPLSSINAVGGIFGFYLAHGNFTNCHNNGEIVVAPTGLASDIQAGGFGGYFAHRIKTKHFEFSNCSNTKKVTFKPAKVNRYGRVGGFIGLASSGSKYVTPGSDTDIFTNCTNSGDVEVSGEGTINELWACSYIGYMSQGATFTNCYTAENTKVDIKVKNVTANACSGWIGECRQHGGGDKYTLTNCTSKVITTFNTAVGGALRFTGLVGGNNALGTPSGSQIVTVSDCFVGGETHIHGTANTISYGGFVRYPYGASSTYNFIRCTNDCDVFIDATTNSQIEAGGIAGYISATLIVDKDTKVTADFNCSANVGSYLAYGGYWGNINHGTTTDNYEGGNTGNITVTGTVGTNLVLGGIGAQHKAKINVNGIYNKGNIYLGTKEKALTVGANADNYIRVGGISCGGATGYDKDKLVHSLENVTNTGDIIAENLVINGFTQERVWFGGIMGYASSTITGATSYCDIKAIGYNNVGMIMGSPRIEESVTGEGEAAVTTAAIKAINCKVGGTICKTTEEKEDSEGTLKPVPVVVTIAADNFQDYIYGGDTEWVGTDYDGCSFLSVAPTI